jgi:hypothetical protein
MAERRKGSAPSAGYSFGSAVVPREDGENPSRLREVGDGNEDDGGGAAVAPVPPRWRRPLWGCKMMPEQEKKDRRPPPLAPAAAAKASRRDVECAAPSGAGGPASAAGAAAALDPVRRDCCCCRLGCADQDGDPESLPVGSAETRAVRRLKVLVYLVLAVSAVVAALGT